MIEYVYVNSGCHLTNHDGKLLMLMINSKFFKKYYL